MERLTLIQQVNSLMSTTDELLSDFTIAGWHSALLEEAKYSFAQIQKQFGITIQDNLTEQIEQELAYTEEYIRVQLETPMKALRRLMEDVHLSPLQRLQLLMELGKTHYLLGQWNQALDVFYQALDFSENISEQKAEILKYMGHIKSRQREYSSAASLYSDSMAIYNSLQNMSEVANIHINEGLNYFERNMYEQAENYYQLALKIATDQEDSQIIADCKHNLGILATVRGSFDDAIKYYKQCIETYENLQSTEQLASTYLNLALLQVDTEQLEEASKSYQRSLEYAQHVGNVELIGIIHLNRAELAIKQDDLTTAQMCCRHALKMFGRTGDENGIAETYKFLGCIYAREKKWQQAERVFQRSIQIFEECKNPLNVAEVRYEYGLMCIEQGRKEVAKWELNRALDSFSELQAISDVQKVKAALEEVALRS